VQTIRAGFPAPDNPEGHKPLGLFYGFKTTTRYARVKRKGYADEYDIKVLLLI
jgi:hypothetical protein